MKEKMTKEEMMTDETMKEETMKEEEERRTPIQQVCGNLASFQLCLIAYYTSTPANTPGYLYLYLQLGLYLYMCLYLYL